MQSRFLAVLVQSLNQQFDVGLTRNSAEDGTTDRQAHSLPGYRGFHHLFDAQRLPNISLIVNRVNNLFVLSEHHWM